MRFRRSVSPAFLGIALIARALAQDVTVTDPVWLRSTPAPEVMPQARSRLRPDFPRELRRSDEIGYVMMIRQTDAIGKSLSFFMLGSERAFQRAVEAELLDWEMKPARDGGHAVSADFWMAVIFNPASSAKENPNSTARLLAVAPVWVPGKLLRPLGDFPVVRAHLDIGAAGNVTAMTLESDDNPELAEAMRDAVLRWQFAPARQNGQPVASTVNLPIVLNAPIGAALASGSFTMASPIKQVRAEYPETMRLSHLRGEVVVGFVVDAQGALQNAVVQSSNNPGFDEAALKAVRQWKFKPAIRDGKPVASNLEVSIVFNFTDGSATDAFKVQNGDMAKMPAEYQYDTPPHIHGTALPVYPYELLRDNVSGDARVLFLIDPRGRVTDARVINATRPEFGLALLAAVETFQFDPALKQGKPTQTVLSQDQHFSLTMLTVADLSNPGFSGKSAEDDYFLSTRVRKRAEELVGANTLDHPLHPISTHRPIFPTGLPKEIHHGSALIEIVIDEDGRARIPRVVSATDPAFGYAAVQALASWRFDPPTVGGKRVTTRVQVPFDFVLKS